MVRCLLLLIALFVLQARPSVLSAEHFTLQELLDLEKAEEITEGLTFQCRAVRSHLSDHPKIQTEPKAHRAAHATHFRDSILVVSWFIGDGRSATRYRLDSHGIVSSDTRTYSWTVQAWMQKKLPDDQLKTAKKLLGQFPQSGAQPPIDRTVYVSFKTGEKWRTETYDSQAVPKAVVDVLDILGNRNKRKK